MRNNPILYTDPTGYMEQVDDGGGKCGVVCLRKIALAEKVHKKFKNVKIEHPNDWQLRDIQEVFYALYQINDKNGFDGETSAISAAFGNVTFVHVPSYHYSGNTVGDANWSTGIINLDANATADTAIHEMGHILDGSLKRINNRVPLFSKINADVFDAGLGATRYARDKNSPSEDFADSFLAVIKYGATSNKMPISQNRIEVITALIQSYTNSDHTLSPGR